MTISSFDVKTVSREYPVFVGQNLIDRIGELIAGSIGRAFIVTDDVISKIHLDPLIRGLESSEIDTALKVLEVGESLKTLDTVMVLYDFLAKNKASRSDTIIALGGGVIGDIAGFVASTFKRGMNLIHVPTSLLAQVDSALGGKTGINLRAGKNLVGTFYQPLAVIVDVCTLDSLPLSDFTTGLAEVIKYGVIMDKELFQFLIDNKKQIVDRDLSIVSTMVERALRNKAQIIEVDEREERGKREVLNFGHTIGHGIEICSNHTVLHGQAVAIGMVEEARIAVRMGHLEKAILESLVSILSMFGLPTKIPEGIDSEQLGEVMKQDKKMRNGLLTLPMLVGLGETKMMAVDPENSLNVNKKNGEDIPC
ncbi:MAG: 3-dehydroquinate synthase [Candidatus Thorarchaeota archaeon]|jgi:3-dehydroquinate synthase